MQEYIALEVSEEGQMLTQFNTYTVTYRYNSQHPQKIIGWISGLLAPDHKKDALLKQFYNKVSNFNLTSKEKELTSFVQQHKKIGYKEIGIELNIKEKTVKRHAKNIIQKVKYAFSHHFVKDEKVTFKAITDYLLQLEFDNDLKEDDNDVPDESLI